MSIRENRVLFIKPLALWERDVEGLANAVSLAGAG
jgi:hypothetical protein